ERYGLEKIKTIGDAYLVVAGAPEPRQDHAAATLDMALAMHATVGSAEMSAGVPIRLRTGVASGPAVAGVIGHRKFSYDIWGDAVNLASRMESTGVPGSIQLAESTWRLCRDRYSFTPRDVEVKGIGAMRTYLLDPCSMRARRRCLQPACGAGVSWWPHDAQHPGRAPPMRAGPGGGGTASTERHGADDPPRPTLAPQKRVGLPERDPSHAPRQPGLRVRRLPAGRRGGRRRGSADALRNRLRRLSIRESATKRKACRVV